MTKPVDRPHKPKGGRHPGAGRPKGAIGKRRRLVAEQLAEAQALAQEMPLDRLLRRMRDESEPERYRDQLAALAAPYCHPRHSPMMVALCAHEMTDQGGPVAAEPKVRFSGSQDFRRQILPTMKSG